MTVDDNNKQRLLNDLYNTEGYGMDFPMYNPNTMCYQSTPVVPTPQSVNNTKTLLDLITDVNQLYRWDISMYPNGTILLYYTDDPEYKKTDEFIQSMINIADASISAFFSYKEQYAPIVVHVDNDNNNLSEILGIFDKVMTTRINREKNK